MPATGSKGAGWGGKLNGNSYLFPMVTTTKRVERFCYDGFVVPAPLQVHGYINNYFMLTASSWLLSFLARLRAFFSSFRNSER